MRYPV
jgi:FMN-binding domain